MRPLRERVAAVQRSLTSLYRLDLDFDAARFVVEPARARALLPPGSPRTGLVVLEEADAASMSANLPVARRKYFFVCAFKRCIVNWWNVL